MKMIFPEHMNERDDEMITAYLRGELSENERIQLDTRRTHDPEFDKLFAAFLKLQAASRASHLETAHQMLRQYATMQSPVEVRRQRVTWPMRIAAALALLLVVGSIWFFLPGENDRLFAAHFSNTIIPGRAELGPQSLSDDAQAFNYYSREQYSKAAKEFDRLYASTNDLQYLLYAAVSHLGAGNLEVAERSLNESMTLIPQRAHEIVYMKALLYIRRNDLSKANDILNEHQDLVATNRQLSALQQDLRNRQ
jgi:tetratricopeptide (TPR) repeat protein